MVWFYEDGITNILSLNNVKKYHVTYDSTACDCFEVHKADGTISVFMPSKMLFYSSVNNVIVLVTTVEINLINSLLERPLMLKSNELQNIIGRPSTQDLINFVVMNLIPNCHVTRQDILRAEGQTFDH